MLEENVQRTKWNKAKTTPSLRNPNYLAFSTLRILLKAGSEIKIFSDKQKLRGFIQGRSALQEILKAI